QRKCPPAAITRKARCSFAVKREVEKHFIGDDRHLARRANRIQLLHFPAFYEVRRRIVGMNNDDSTRARRDGLLQRMKIDLPAMIVNEWIAHQVDVLYFCQKIKQRIAW